MDSEQGTDQQGRDVHDTDFHGMDLVVVGMDLHGEGGEKGEEGMDFYGMDLQDMD